MVMRTLLFLLFFVPLAANSQVATIQPAIIQVEIGCIYSSSGEFAYNAAIVDRLLTNYLGNNLRVTNSRISRNNSGNYIITADVFYPQGIGSVSIVTERFGSKLYITDNSCVHQCMPNPGDPCLYKAEISEVDPCVSVRCSCVGEGENVAKVSVGETRGLQRAALMLKNISPICD